jgi:hypothetical protein
MNLCWPLGLGALLSPRTLASSDSKLASIAVRLGGLVSFLLVVATVLGTKSKGGLVAATAAPAALILAWPLRARMANPGRLAVTVLALAALSAGVFAVGIDVMQHPSERVDLIALSRSDATLQIRLLAVAQSLLMLWDLPVFGCGLGTWDEAFPMYQRFPLLAVSFPYVHNDYVQWVEETGIAGLTLLGALSVSYMTSILRPLSDHASRRRAVFLAAAATVAVHSIVDFGIRIPANALLFSTILGLLWRETSPAASHSAPARLSLLAIPFGAALAALLVFLGTADWRDARAFEAEAQATIKAEGSRSWEVLEHAAWRTMETDGRPDFELAAAAVSASPVVSATHRALAFSYRSTAMRELELRRAIRCAPAFETARLDLAQLLLTVGRRHQAYAEVERAFYENPHILPTELLAYRDPLSGDHAFVTAGRRGLRRRMQESPELSEAYLRRLEDQAKQ